MTRSATQSDPVADHLDLHCPYCAYNLRGLAKHRCPECGREFDPAALRRAAIEARTDVTGLLRGLIIAPAALAIGGIVSMTAHDSFALGMTYYGLITLVMAIGIAGILAARVITIREARGRRGVVAFGVTAFVGFVVCQIVLGASVCIAIIAVNNAIGGP